MLAQMQAGHGDQVSSLNRHEASQLQAHRSPDLTCNLFQQSCCSQTSCELTLPHPKAWPHALKLPC